MLQPCNEKCQTIWICSAIVFIARICKINVTVQLKKELKLCLFKNRSISTIIPALIRVIRCLACIFVMAHAIIIFTDIEPFFKPALLKPGLYERMIKPFCDSAA